MPLITRVKSSSVFQQPSQELLDCLQSRNEHHEPFFLLPTKYISDESALLGEALSELNNRSIHEKTLFRTFFCNSHLEALNGTVKIMRHNNALSKSKDAHSPILIYDPSSRISQFYNPTNAPYGKELVPGLHFIHTFNDLRKELIDKKEYIGFIYLSDGSDDLRAVDGLFALCKKRNIFIGYSTGLYTNWYFSRNHHVFYSSPDVFLYGENLTEWQVPFGCFSMTESIYKPWDSVGTCLLHSSTFSGNTLSLKWIRSLFTRYEVCSFPKTQLNDSERFSKYAKYINPKVSLLYSAINLSPKAIKTQGCKILFEKSGVSTEVLDLVAGSGAAMRGHNPPDLVPVVLQSHDPNEDYWDAFEKQIRDLSSFTQAFPAVSGASAVDIAIILAMLAAEGKTRIIAFSENFSGKSLIALSVTRIEEYQSPFRPLYFDVVEVDPFTNQGAERLEKELKSGEIALVWFEMIQGENLKAIPGNILELLNHYRKEDGFLIGIDEVLSGMFRTGPFLAHQQFPIAPDLVTIGKGMSDMTFPCSAALITEELYQKLIDSHPDLIDLLKTHYLNQLSAHIATHALNWCVTHNVGQQVEKYGFQIKELLQSSVTQSPLFKEIRGKGLFFYLKLDQDALLIKLVGESAVEFALSSKLLNKFGIMIMNSRITPALIISEDEIKMMCCRLSNFIMRESQASLLLFCLWSSMRILFKSLTRVFKCE